MDMGVAMAKRKAPIYLLSEPSCSAVATVAARGWTSEEDALLTQLLAEGKDFGDIALRLKRTIALVQRRAADVRARSAFRDSKLER